MDSEKIKSLRTPVIQDNHNDNFIYWLLQIEVWNLVACLASSEAFLVQVASSHPWASCCKDKKTKKNTFLVTNRERRPKQDYMTSVAYSLHTVVFKIYRHAQFLQFFFLHALTSLLFVHSYPGGIPGMTGGIPGIIGGTAGIIGGIPRIYYLKNYFFQISHVGSVFQLKCILVVTLFVIACS